MGFKPKKGDAPSTGRVRPSVNFERTMALASQIAAESVPDEHTVTANEQAPAVVARGVLESVAPVAQTAAPAASAAQMATTTLPVQQPAVSAVPGELPRIAPSEAVDVTPVLAAEREMERTAGGSAGQGAVGGGGPRLG